jgi:hypothetical protein
MTVPAAVAPEIFKNVLREIFIDIPWPPFSNLEDESETHPLELNKYERLLDLWIFLRSPPVRPLELYESEWIEGIVARSSVKDTTKDFFVKEKMGKKWRGLFEIRGEPWRKLLT